MQKYIHKVNYYETDKMGITLVGRTRHCFVDNNNKPIILKRSFPKLDIRFKDLVMN